MTQGTDHDLRDLRARYCYRAVAAWSPRWRYDAKSRVQGIPIEIRLQGLIVALATLMGEGNDQSRHLANSLARWILTDAPRRPLSDSRSTEDASPDRLLEDCAKADRATYAAVQQEAMLFFDQIKIYASALLKARES